MLPIKKKKKKNQKSLPVSNTEASGGRLKACISSSVKQMKYWEEWEVYGSSIKHHLVLFLFFKYSVE